MRKFQIPRLEVKEYNKMIRYLKTLPDYKRTIAEKKLFLIKSYEATARKEIRRLGKKFRKVESIERYCDRQGINPKTFYGYIRQYEKDGIEGLIPHGWGHTKGANTFNFLLPQIREYYQYGEVTPGKVFEQLREYCVEQGFEYPSEATVRRMIKKSNFYKKKKNKPQKNSPDIRALTPDTIKIVDKKTFNIAMYKYALVLPFLAPSASHDEKKLKQEICNRTHHPFPGVTFKITETTLNHYILQAKRNGVDGLIPKHCYRKTQSKTGIRASIFIKYARPWESISELEKIISSLSSDYEYEKEITLNLLRNISGYTDRFMYNPLDLKLDIHPDILNELQELKTSSHKHISNKATGILMAYNNHSLQEISMVTGHAIKTIQAWFPKFIRRGIDFIKRKPDLKEKKNELKTRKNRIIDILHQAPKDFNINRTAWTLQTIADAYQKKYGVKWSIKTISRDIKKTDYTWKRARIVLTSPDPNYKEKTQKVLETLRSLGPKDAFFFVDEAGPWRVKKYGGKSLTAKGEVKIVPQFQRDRGSVSFIGALDAIQNQVIHIPIKSKDTTAVISLIKILCRRYRQYSTLNITWDCASWHNSKELKEFLADLKDKNVGPKINIVPLPKRSQFLNVIESVFGGAKRAVIFNSNYQSKREMRRAISRHFRERNKYYKNNPKRAGNKIWDKEFFEIGDFKGGVYKKQM